ncbi:hypothetical protein [Marinobacterium jannaschii]|uniref:hypothetical protein n=1 Tax=Marinobacterium jannaschii TaxID=64970 RepID=UPI0004877D57|nr:hypothetical protein [Marinobacterium jannaschii]
MKSDNPLKYYEVPSAILAVAFLFVLASSGAFDKEDSSYISRPIENPEINQVLEELQALNVPMLECHVHYDLTSCFGDDDTAPYTTTAGGTKWAVDIEVRPNIVMLSMKRDRYASMTQEIEPEQFAHGVEKALQGIVKSIKNRQKWSL